MNTNTNTNLDLESNVYNKKINEFLTEIPGRIYVFEITKFCGYSTFIFMYKDETLLDLWSRVSHHFSCNDIKGLYIDNCLNKNLSNNDDTINNNNNNTVCNDNNKCCCCANKTDKYIPVPMSSLKKVREFVYENISPESRNMKPVYPIPLPVVYRIYLDDGHCHGIM
jgi:hypothetical protein